MNKKELAFISAVFILAVAVSVFSLPPVYHLLDQVYVKIAPNDYRSLADYFSFHTDRIVFKKEPYFNNQELATKDYVSTNYYNKTEINSKLSDYVTQMKGSLLVGIKTFSDGSESKTLLFSPDISSFLVYIKIQKNVTVMSATMDLLGDWYQYKELSNPLSNPSFEWSGGWSYSENEGCNSAYGCTKFSGNYVSDWSTVGSKSYLIKVDKYNGVYSYIGGSYAQISQSVILPPDVKVLGVDIKTILSYNPGSIVGGFGDTAQIIVNDDILLSTFLKTSKRYYIDISKYAGSQVTLKFRLWIDTCCYGSSLYHQAKYYIDNIKFYDFEYPINPAIDIGDDGTVDWSYTGEFNTTEKIDFSSTLESLAEDCNCPNCFYDANTNYCMIPIRVSSDSPAKIVLDNLRIITTIE